MMANANMEVRLTLDASDVLERLGDSGETERRTFAGAVECRAEGAGPKLEGYAAIFNEETVIGGTQYGFREVIDPRAFSAAVNRDDVRALMNHDPNLVLGRNKAGTLQLSVDNKGLRYVIDAPDTSYGRDLVVSVKRGDVSQSSFAFRVTKDEWTDPPKGSKELPLRRVLETELFDVSPVTYPAYTATTVSARDKAKAAVEMRDLPETIEEIHEHVSTEIVEALNKAEDPADLSLFEARIRIARARAAA